MFTWAGISATWFITFLLSVLIATKIRNSVHIFKIFTPTFSSHFGNILKHILYHILYQYLFVHLGMTSPTLFDKFLLSIVIATKIKKSLHIRFFRINFFIIFRKYCKKTCYIIFSLNIGMFNWATSAPTSFNIFLLLILIATKIQKSAHIFNISGPTFSSYSGNIAKNMLFHILCQYLYVHLGQNLPDEF